MTANHSSRTRILLFSLLAATLLAPLLDAQEEVDAGPSLAIVVSEATLRERADSSSRSVGVVPEGTSVAVVGAYKEWRRIRVDDRAGWIAATLLDTPQSTGLEEAVLAAARSEAGPCADDLQRCEPSTCADTPEEELLHTRKRRRVSGRPIPLSMQHFIDLQRQTDRTIGQAATVSSADMPQLRRALRLRGSTFLGEGKTVEFFGYLVGDPKGSGAENVNCKLPTPDVDFHINVADGPNRTEYKSIVVEMIPQGRLGEWTTRKLKKIARDDLPVRVTGQLFYDNKHFVRDRRSPDERMNQSKRHSLWEIHPVTKFQVCPAADCEPGDRAGWVALADWPG